MRIPINIRTIDLNDLNGLKPLQDLSSAKAIKNSSFELSSFASILASISEPMIQANRLQKKYIEGKPVNLDEMKIAQMKASTTSDLAVKIAGKVVHFFESTSSMQV